MVETHVRVELEKALSAGTAEAKANDRYQVFNFNDDGTVWACTGPGFRPWFVKNSPGQIDTPQRKIFGLYLIRASIRSVLLATRAIAAGDLLNANEFHAGASALYYTAAYHALDGLLASRGRALVQPVHGLAHAYHRTYPKRRNAYLESVSGLDYETLPGNPAVICAILSRKGTWSFESRGQSHQQRWAELKQLVSPKGATLPDYVIRALSYARGNRDPRSLSDVLRGKPKPPTPVSDLLRDGIPALTRLRHQALYEGFGYDTESYDALLNRDSFGDGLEFRSQILRALAEGLVSDGLSVADIVFSWKADSLDASLVRARLAMSIMVPDFEFDESVDSRLPGGVGRIIEWLAPPMDR